MTTRWADAARLVRRTGFGATGAQVDAVVRTGTERHVAAALAADPEADPGARVTPTPSLPWVPVPKDRRDNPAAKKAFRTTTSEQRRTLESWWLRRMVTVDEPLGEKLTVCWHNHFATSIAKVRSAAQMLAQNETLRRRGRGDFRDLGYAMLTDPAMLRWLDGEKNSATSPNENLSREFMELFALGHDDGYTEDDVRAGACALTGWRIDRGDGTASYVAARHDTSVVTFLGHTGDLDTSGYLDAVLAVPGHPAYLATRWWAQIASNDAPSAALVARLTAAYGPGRDLSAMFAALLTAPEFSAASGTIVTTPVEWFVGACRALGLRLAGDKDARLAVATVRQLGQEPFAPPSVGGWPSGRAWLSTAAAQIRARVTQRLVREGDLSAVDDAGRSRLDATAHLLGIATWTDATLAALRPLAASPPRLVAAALTSPEYLIN